MAINDGYDLHGLYAAQLDATVLGGLQSQSLETGTQVEQEVSDGQPYPHASYITQQNPRATLQTKAIGTWLAAGTGGLISIQALTTGLKLFAQKFTDEGMRTSGSAHRKFTVTRGLLVPTSLEVGSAEDATLSLELTVSADGTNDPIQLAEASALPSLPAGDEVYTLGPVTIGGVALKGVRRVSINWGLTIQASRADGQIWPQKVFVATFAPRLTIRGVNSAWLAAAAIPLAGKAATHANTTIYLARRANHGTVEANNQTKHVKLTACGLCYVESLSASGSAPGETSLSAPLDWDGTNLPLVITTGSAIS